jgi:hypothetical protein
MFMWHPRNTTCHTGLRVEEMLHKIHIGTFPWLGMLPISRQHEEVFAPRKEASVNDGGCATPVSDGVRHHRPDQGRNGPPVPAYPGGEPARRKKRVPVECGDLPFLIRRDGTWLYRGTPINRKELVCLFASVLRREADGSWWLQTPAERGRIEVEDAPFVAVELDWSGEGRNQTLSFRTNIDQVITAGPEHPIRVSHDIITCEPTPYLLVRKGVGSLNIEARINRATYYELVALAVPEWVGSRRMLGVWSQGHFFPLGELPPGEE